MVRRHLPKRIPYSKVILLHTKIVEFPKLHCIVHLMNLNKIYIHICINKIQNQISKLYVFFFWKKDIHLTVYQLSEKKSHKVDKI